jgi:mitochondrial import receptor subunit TOM70
MAASLKAKGNSAYQQRKFAEAADLYTQAINISPKADPVFYSNRAACTNPLCLYSHILTLASPGYVNMSTPRHELVIEDCNTALSLDRNYVKALNRRAGALEGLKRYEEALRGTSDDQRVVVLLLMVPLVDFTAGTILEKFQNDNAAQAVERVLKKLSTEKAAEILAVSHHTTFPEYFLRFSLSDTRKSSPLVHIHLCLLCSLPVKSALPSVAQVDCY